MDIAKRERAALMGQRTIKAVTYFLLTLWAITVLFPFYWMVIAQRVRRK